MLKNFFLISFVTFSISFTSFATEIPKVNATSAIALDTATGRILYEKNGFAKKPMASTTKVMTAIIAVENNDLNDIVTVSKKAAATGGSSAHLKSEQKIKLNELLYGLMLNSGNDAAVAIAEHTAGSVEEFAKLMNSKAIEIGAFNTNFVTPHGLDTQGHYSTAYDMALIASYALKNATISKLVSTKEKHMSFINGVGHNLRNTNQLLSIYPGATGVKTGYTGMAGRCLIGSAERNNWEVVTVVFGEPTSSSRLKDTAKILDYCFANYKFIDLRELYEIKFSIPILKGIKSECIPVYKNPLVIPITETEKGAITVRKEVIDELTAPILKNCTVGKLEFLLNDTVLGSIPLVIDADIQRLKISDYYKSILYSFLSISSFN